MLFKILLLLLTSITLVNSSSFSLHKHRHGYSQQQPSIDEKLPILDDHQTGDACGEATLSCMAFGTGSNIPIRCGSLKATLCKRAGDMKCTAFCDTDGSGRLCQKAFPNCCTKSVNGCTSSNPKNLLLYPSK